MHNSLQRRFEKLDVDAIVTDQRAFKAKLAIGENAYFSSQVISAARKSVKFISAAHTGAKIAKTSYVAAILATTPHGALVAGIATGVGYLVVSKKLEKLKGPVEVIPVFINSPIDILANQLFALLAPLVLKMVGADNEFHAAEMRRARQYFVDSWGYNPRYVEKGLELYKAHLSLFRTEDIAEELAIFCRTHKDCNFRKITDGILDLLQELMEADNKIHPNEEFELKRIRRTFRQQGGLGLIP
ncbi:MAG: TerB family tellurite resistance protein [Rhodobacteraceae bacterium]|nr:TerB family tellurite resistance protein [Paracoccaceae bacterium]